MKGLKIAAMLLCFALASPALAATYTVTAIGPAGSDAFGVNNLGNVVGSTPNGSATDPFMWTAAGGLHDLGTLGGNSVARAINDNNWVVGQSDDYPFRWNAAGGLVQLGNNFVIADTSFGDARAINNSNTIVGSGDLGGAAMTQVWSAPNYGATTPYLANAFGNGINDSGVYVAHAGPGNQGYPTSNYFSSPNSSGGLGEFLPDAINNANQIVGIYLGVASMVGVTPQFTTTIGKLNASDSSSEAFAINDANQVVGVSTGTGAFLWDSTHGIQNLSHLLAPGSSGWTILSGNGINNNGQIVGLGQLGGQQFAVLLTPTPEPSSIVLAVLGLAGLLLAARRSSVWSVAAVLLLGTQFFASGRTALAADEVEDFQEAIFVGDSDGSNLKQLTDFDGYKSQGSPCWTSDGQFIAFDAYKPQLGQQFFDGHIIVVKADGTNPRDLGPGILPSLSPKGHRVVYCRHLQMGGTPGVYLMDLSDPDTNALVDEKGWGAEWSPDGTRLAYTRGRNLRLYDVIEGTSTSLLDEEQSAIASIRWNFCWSPDSRQIAFVADTTSGRYVVAIANADGEKQKAKVIYEGDMGSAVAWRPLRNEIVIESTRDDRPGFQSLFAVKVDAPGEPVRLTTKPVDRRLRNPAFSPDGKKIAVSVFARLPGDD